MRSKRDSKYDSDWSISIQLENVITDNETTHPFSCKNNSREIESSTGISKSPFFHSLNNGRFMASMLIYALVKSECCNTLSWDLRFNALHLDTLTEDTLLCIISFGSIHMCCSTGSITTLKNVYPTEDDMYGKVCHNRRTYTIHNVTVLRHQTDVWIILTTLRRKHQLYKIVHQDGRIMMQPSRIVYRDAAFALNSHHFQLHNFNAKTNKNVNRH